MNSDIIKAVDYILIIGALSLWYFYVFCAGKKEKGFLLKFRIRDIAFFLVLGFLVQISASELLSFVLEQLDKTSEYSELISKVMEKTPYIVLYVCLLGPLCEELMFRGIIFSYLGKISPFILANMIQALAFGIYHRNIYQGVYTFILGFLLGYIDHLYDSIFPSVLVHISINISGLFIEMPLSELLNRNVMSYIAAAAFVFCVLILFYMAKKREKPFGSVMRVFIAFLTVLFIPASAPLSVSAETKDQDRHIGLSVTDPGYDVFRPVDSPHFDYRYGPSMILNDDGSIDAYFSAPGDGQKEYDWISYRHSDDNGATWSEDKMILSSDPGSRDSVSVCDPDVFYYAGYYYLGYTSTLDHENKGLANSVFLARSRYPDGPFSKWDGKGYGKEPVPIVCYDGTWLGWGAGEPSFVVLDDTLYLYTTMDTYAADYVRVRTTEVRTADLRDPDWPSKLEYRGVAVVRTDNPGEEGYEYNDCDSWDVAYIEEYGKFVSVCTNRRFNRDSCILYYESDDGINFEGVSELNENIICGCHNCGIMGDKSAHIKKGDRTFLGYAYGGSGDPKWGMWATRFAPFSISLKKDSDTVNEEKENLKERRRFTKRSDTMGLIFFSTDRLTAIGRLGDSSIPLSFYIYDEAFIRHPVNADFVRLTGYDRRVINTINGRVIPAGEGITYAYAEYEGFKRRICFVVTSGEDYGRVLENPGMTDFFSPVEEYNIDKNVYYLTAVRPLARYEDNSIREIKCITVKNPEFVLSSADMSICGVSPDGVLIPMAEGSTIVTVTSNTGRSYSVRVNVTDREKEQ